MILLPKFSRQNDLTFAGDFCFHGSKIASYQITVKILMVSTRRAGHVRALIVIAFWRLHTRIVAASTTAITGFPPLAKLQRHAARVALPLQRPV